MDRIMPSEVKFCTNLSDDSRTMISNQPSGLCIVCYKIDFVSLTSEACESSSDERHFHIGTFQHVAKKGFCPGCRLILSAARSIDRSYDAFNETTITIRRRYISAYDPKSHHSLREHETTKDKTLIRHTLHMESLIEVIFDQYKHGPGEYKNTYSSDSSMVTGTIIRTKETIPAKSSALRRLIPLKRSILQSEEPFRLRGRHVPPKVDINLIKHWMQSCSVQHDRCRLPTLTTAREQEIRLIDIQNYRIILATLIEKYVALSYVWGPNTKPLLTQDIVSQCSCKNGLKSLVIPQTISDAIKFVSDIGERYLWVDSLCIVQDDDDDKQQQLPIMASIYSNAELIVVAAAGTDANAGLPGIRSTRRCTSQRTEDINGVRFITAQPAVRQVLDWSVWNSRGWTLQETALSRRALVFTQDLVYWNCVVDTWREDISCKSSSAKLFQTEINLLPGFFVADDSICQIGLYCQMVQVFSRRHFKEESDVIWALVGILKLQASYFKEGFIWGLPYEGLDENLLWLEDSGCPFVHSRDARHVVVRKGSCYNLPYPSWSWLSVGSSVSIKHPRGMSIISEVTWHQPIKLRDKGLATYPKLIHSDAHTDEQEIQPSINLLARSSSETDVMDYGLLYFTAQAAVLTLKRADPTDRNGTHADDKDGDEIYRDESSQKPPSARNRWIKATIHSPVGEWIGTLNVPLTFFNEKSECPGEFLLLSTNVLNKSDDTLIETTSAPVLTEPIIHESGCRCGGTQNIMLIEWSGGIAYRRSIGSVKKENWLKVKTEVKKIFLG